MIEKPPRALTRVGDLVDAHGDGEIAELAVGAAGTRLAIAVVLG
jgi:hypothetical protein